MQSLPSCLFDNDLADSTPACRLPQITIRLVRFAPFEVQQDQAYKAVIYARPRTACPCCSSHQIGLGQDPIADDSLGARVDAEDFDKTCNFFQMSQGQPHGFVISAQNVNKEAVLPGPSSHRARFDFAQIKVAQSKDA